MPEKESMVAWGNVWDTYVFPASCGGSVEVVHIFQEASTDRLEWII